MVVLSPQCTTGALRSLVIASRVLLIALLGLSIFERSVYADEALGSKVKAAFIYNFIKFVKWPPGTLSNPADQFTICTAAPEAVGRVLDETVGDKSADGHPLRVRTLKKEDDLTACQVLFLSGPDGSKFAGRVLPFSAQGILIILDDDVSAQYSGAGMITFLLENSRMRFAINNNLAEHANIAISSKLLSLAARMGR